MMRLQSTWSSSSLAGILMAVAAVGAPRAAHACSTAAPAPKLDGLPSDAARDVPTDVVPVYALYDAQIQAQDVIIEMTTSSGAAIPVTPRISFGFVEVAPNAPLEPSTTYVVHVRGPNLFGSPEEPDVDLATTFTTGLGSSGAAPKAPSVAMQHYVDYPSVTTCAGYPQGTCIGLPSDGLFQLVFRPYPTTDWVHGSRLGNLTGIDQGTPFDCVDVSQRGLNGVFGEATTVCRGDAPFYSLPAGGELQCTADGLTVNAIPVTAQPIPSPKAGGCAVSGTSLPARGAHWLAALGVAALWGIRRRNPRA